jgi:hypothetical protein
MRRLLLLLLAPSLPLMIGCDRAQDAGPSLAAPGRQPGELERVQMHGNRLRGMHYLSTWHAGDEAQPDRFTVRPVRDITLDGDPRLNVRGNVYPIDVHGHGRFGLLHFNGYRLMRVYSAAGRKLWQVENPIGRAHRSFSHRDTLAILDADGDGGQDIVHCWSAPGVADKLLVLRDGETGRVLRQVRVAGQKSSEECQIAAFRVEGRAEPLVLVAAKAADRDCAKGNWTPYIAKTIAYGPDLTKLWERTTCAAGHYAWPLAEDGDGRAEAVFVGKYLLRLDGTTRCVLTGFGMDHVDSMVVADLDPALPGLETLTVGASGTRFHGAGDCVLRWTIPDSVIRNAQQTAAAYLHGTGGGAPGMLVTTKLPDRAGDYTLRAYALDARGRAVGSYVENLPRLAVPVQNANVDGVPSAEDRVTTFGQVVDQHGRRRSGTSWYWDLQRPTAEEALLDPREQWARTPFAFDLDNDGRDELIVWGRHKLVVGTLSAP